ncbi:hypothetical protein TanjilG_29004 [Lupinus angustifolius]|uniref:Membrane protein of ER body-like protein n=1 Tax=Lupinus angustifolius TaxID=3871 RepID=A0A4P1RSX3_LUPAN|nr:hypothetical protein TanjilG_29004 [Lupinus angustifolius]
MEGVENVIQEVDLKQPIILSSNIDVQGGVQELHQTIVIQDVVNHEIIIQSEENNILPTSDSPIPENDTYLTTATIPEIGAVGITIENDEEIKELYLESVFHKLPTEGFYCPNCKTCIQKVYIQKGELKQIITDLDQLPPTDTFRCSSCFSFLIPIGNWLSGLVSGENGGLNQQGTRSSAGNDVTSPDSSNQSTLTPQDQKGLVAPRKEHFWSDWTVIGWFSKATKHKQGKQTSIEENKQPLIPREVVVVVEEVASNKALEILKSIVYGGLIESLASLSVVTSAASADATTLSIVALAIANLIGGLFIFAHNLGELKAESVDRYKELLGEKKNFILHSFIAIISFIIFGLVPPLVYGFSFHESGDKDHKIGAVLAASVLCITLLSIAKAYIQRSNSFVAYFKTVLYYVSTGSVLSVFSYLAGDLVKKLLEKVPWIEPSSNYALHVHGMMKCAKQH